MGITNSESRGRPHSGIACSSGSLLLFVLCGGALLIVFLVRFEGQLLPNERLWNEGDLQLDHQPERSALVDSTPLAKELAELREVNKQLQERLIQESRGAAHALEEDFRKLKLRYDAKLADHNATLFAKFQKEVENEKTRIESNLKKQNESLIAAYNQALEQQKVLIKSQLRDEMTKQLRKELENQGRLESAISAQLGVGNIWTERTRQLAKLTQISMFSAPAVRVRFKKPQLSNTISDEIEARQNWTSAQWKAAAMEMFAANRLKEGGYVMLCLANSGMKELLMNMLASLLRNGYTKFVILCYDFALYRFLCEWGLTKNAVMLPSEWANMPVASGAVEWESDGYNQMLLAKTKIVLELLKLGVNIFHIDADLVFLGPNVVSAIWTEYNGRSLPEYLFQCDQARRHPIVLSKPVPEYSHDEIWETDERFTDGGLWLARPTPNVIRFYNLTLEKLAATPGLVDQFAMNDVAHNIMNFTRDSRVATGLSPYLFPSGWMVVAINYTQRTGIYPMVVHANYLVGNAQKKNFLKSMNMWYIDDDFA